ncbi:MAG TPA: hypothetical protein VEA61_03615 [Allosphingosinicella sp.]|nr:hypothetical protein [Allosphingosinicella sp.]
MRIMKIGVYPILPYVASEQTSTPYSDAFIQWMFDEHAMFSLRRYWREVSNNEVGIDPTIFGTMLVEGQSYIDRLCWPNTRRLGAAYEALGVLIEFGKIPLAFGKLAIPFDGLVFLILGHRVDGGSAGLTIQGRKFPVCYFDDRGGHSFMAHELGHLLGLDHPFDTNVLGNGYRYGEYADPTCIMSADNFGGMPAPFPVPAGYRMILDPKSRFWSSAGPGVSMATLWRYAPDFPAAQPFSMQLPPLAPPTQIRINRAGEGGIQLVTMPATGPNSWYAVQYRPAVLWDRGLSKTGIHARAGVVVHQIRESIGWASDGEGWPKTKRVCFAGTVPVPSTGDLDWGDGKFAVRVLAATPQWAEVLVGSWLPAAQSISVSVTTTSTLATSSSAEPIEVSNTQEDCGVHSYHALRSDLNVDIEAEVTSTGFAKPEFRYELNGVALGLWTDPTNPQSGSVIITVPVKVPTAIGQHVEQKKWVAVSFNYVGHKLWLHLPGGDGAYDVVLTAFVADDPAIGMVGLGSAPVTIPVNTATIGLPAEAMADQLKCIARIADEMRQLPRVPGDEEHPDWLLTSPDQDEWLVRDLATLGRRMLETERFWQAFPAIGEEDLSSLASHLKRSPAETVSLITELRRQALDRPQPVPT